MPNPAAPPGRWLVAAPCTAPTSSPPRRGGWPLRRPACSCLLALLVLLTAIGPPAAAAPLLGDNQWTKRDLDGVRVAALAVETDPNALYAGSSGGGAFQTTNGGESWRPVNTGLANEFVNVLSIDPTDQMVALAGTGRGAAVGEPTAGIYRTTNRGASWTVTLPNSFVRALARTAQNPRVVYAGGTGVFKTADGGATWARLALGDPVLTNTDLLGLAVSPADPNLLIAVGNTEGGTGRIMRSTDGGATWTLSLGGLAPLFDVEFASSGPVVLVGGQAGLFRSTDRGATFQPLGSGPSAVAVLDVLFDPLAAGRAFVGTEGRGVFQSSDDGATWAPLEPGLGNQTVRALAISRASPPTLFAGTDGGVFAFTFAQSPTTTSWYFAEGSTQRPFDTWFLVQNPTDQPARVRFTFQLQGGGEVVRDVRVEPTSRFSLFANQVIPDRAFSTRVDADRRVFAERAMYVGYDGHAVTGIAAPDRTWLFAEGSSQSPFHTWLLLQNPNPQPTAARITYFLPSGPPATQSLTLPPTSRTSVFVNAVLPDAAFSTRVESDLPIVAERAMYRFPGNAATGVSGVNAPSARWYFAHGDTQAGAHTWLLLQNPGDTPAAVTVSLLQETGNRATLSLNVAPTSRQSLFLNQTLGSHRFGVVVESSQPIVAEKSLFFGGEPRGAAATQGSPALGTTWNLPEGSTAPPFDELIAILNPNPAALSAHLDLQLPNGQVVGRDVAIGPTRTMLISVDDLIPNSAVSTRVTTSLPSAVERTMYFRKAGALGGHNTIGILLPPAAP